MMNNFGKFACALLVSGGLAAPAFAADSTSSMNGAAGQATTNAGSMNDAGQMNQSGQINGPARHIAQHLRSDLTKAGFTDVKIMPSSFLVRAKDSQGNPVMMVINPDSVTALTEEKIGASSASNANHSMSGSASHNKNSQSNNSSGSSSPNDTARGAAKTTP